MSRASDDTREHAVAVLRKGLVSGRLGTDTFVRRVDAAYRAKTHDELAAVTEDLPRRRSLWQVLVGGRIAAPARLEPPPMQPGERRVLGRACTCDYAVADPTVSMRHAELVRLADGWLIRDLGSRNGTRVNGWLATVQRLSPGDTLTLGATVFRFQPRGVA